MGLLFYQAQHEQREEIEKRAKQAAYMKKYLAENRDKVRLKAREYQRNRRKDNPEFREKERERLKKSKSHSKFFFKRKFGFDPSEEVLSMFHEVRLFNRARLAKKRQEKELLMG